MFKRPFQFGLRPLPNGAEDSPESLAALLADCQGELAVIDQLSPLKLSEMKGKGRGKMNALKTQYLEEGRYGEEFLKRRSDLSNYLFRMGKQGRLVWLRRGLRDLLQTFEGIKYQLNALDPTLWDEPVGEPAKPDNLSDALAQGIGVGEVL